MNKASVIIGVLGGLVIGFAVGQYYITETPFDQCIRTHIEERVLDGISDPRHYTVTFPNGETRDGVPLGIETYEQYLRYRATVDDINLRSAYDDCNNLVYSGVN